MAGPMDELKTLNQKFHIPQPTGAHLHIEGLGESP